METVRGRIVGYNEQKKQLAIIAEYDNHDRLVKRQYKQVEVRLDDGRTISAEQRRKAYVLMAEIAEWCGETPEYIKRHMKLDFVVGRLEKIKQQLFSLSDCDMTLARHFITHLIDFMFEHEVPTSEPLYSLCDDIERYVYSALMHKRCVVCGRKAELHHYDQVGMGRNRATIYQIGMRVMPLCREHHTVAHSKGKGWLKEDMHLVPLPLTKEIGKVYGLTKKNLEEAANE